MRLRRSDRFADRCTLLLANAIGYGETITEDELDTHRQLAFEAVDGESFALHYLASECLSKWSENKLESASTDAYLGFEARERVNATVNKRLSSIQYTRVIGEACRLVEMVIKPITVESVLRRCNFSSGASAGVSRKTSTIPHKWHTVNSRNMPQFATLGTIPYVRAFARANPHGALGRLTVVPGDAVTTVNKSWKIDRIINPQPAINLFLQKGLGSELRSNLRLCGLLHPNAQETQRARARQGSIDGLTATLDLKDASMSVTKGMVDTLVEGPVWKMIYDFRAPGTWGGLQDEDGKFCEEMSLWNQSTSYEMISTMGNGFTFELETLLFWALTAAACKERGHHWSSVTVYGDDIICPSDSVPDVLGILEEFGLVINRQKSFWEGPFRESCGGHYWNGEDVTPFYLKRSPDNVADVVLLHNKVLSWCNARGWAHPYDFTDLLRFCRRETPKELRGPIGLPGCLWSRWDSAVPSWDRSTQSYAQRVIVKGSEQVPSVSDEASYLSWLWRRAQDKPSKCMYDSVARSVQCLRVPKRRVGFLSCVEDTSLTTSDVTESWEQDENRYQKHKLSTVYVDRDAWDIPRTWNLDFTS